MATDPAVQAARLVYDAWSSSQDEIRNFDTMVAVMTTVLPSIRAQAFTEAADMLLATEAKIASEAMYSTENFGYCAALVRGLGEETENA